MSVEYPLYASTVPDSGDTHCPTPEGAYSLVWSLAGYPRRFDPGPQHPAPFPLPVSHCYQSLREPQGPVIWDQKKPSHGSGALPMAVLPSPPQAAAPETLRWGESGRGHTASFPQGHPSSWSFMGCLAPTAGWAPRGWSKSYRQAIPFQERPGQSLMGSRPLSSILWSDALLIPLPTHTEPVLPARDREPQRPPPT